MRTAAASFLNNFFKESNIDERVYTVCLPGGGSRFMSTSCVIESILDASPEEQESVSNALIHISIRGGSLHSYMGELARALTLRRWLLSR